MAKTHPLTEAIQKKKAADAAPAAVPLYLSTGSTLLNLACTGRISAGFIAGHIYTLVGDSSSGKSFLSLTCLAEASVNKAFDNYRFIYDDVEQGALMDFARFFGPKMAERVEPPARGRHGEPANSRTAEEFYDYLDDNLAQGPCVYVLDSMDALSSESEIKKFTQNRKARRKSEEGEAEIKGSYGDGKAKVNSSGLRVANQKVTETNSIVIIIFQTRDNIGFNAIYNPKIRSGGHAPTFYSSLEFWSSIRARIKRRVKGKEREVGIISRVRTKKNRISGRDRTVDIPIYYSVGIDDIGSCVNYLIAERHWKGTEETVEAEEFNYSGDKDGLIAKIEEGGLEKELRLLTLATWNEIESSCAVSRKNRYEQ